MTETLDQQIRDNADAPTEVSIDGQTVKKASLPDQIAADKHLASRAAAGKSGLGIKIVRLRPGSTIL